MTATDFIARFEQEHPRFSGHLELHYFRGALKDVKSMQSHRDQLDRGMPRKEEAAERR